MRSMLKAARDRMSRAASSGTIPARAIASTAASSTCSQVSYFRWSLQMRPISGFVYRGIMSAERKPLLWKLEAVHGTEHGRRESTVGEQIARHTLDVGRGHPLDPFECLVETELTVEVDFLTGEVRHPRGRALEVQHQAALQMILGAAQLRLEHRLVLDA